MEKEKVSIQYDFYVCGQANSFRVRIPDIQSESIGEDNHKENLREARKLLIFFKIHFTRKNGFSIEVRRTRRILNHPEIWSMGLVDLSKKMDP